MAVKQKNGPDWRGEILGRYDPFGDTCVPLELVSNSEPHFSSPSFPFPSFIPFPHHQR